MTSDTKPARVTSVVLGMLGPSLKFHADRALVMSCAGGRPGPRSFPSHKT